MKNIMKESQYATLIDKTKVYISGMEFEDDEKINIINALELQICDSYRMDAAKLHWISAFLCFNIRFFSGDSR